jgi:catechol 2,3-dioxygenase-like lactoylglutathione lyase family enzyme
MKITPVLIVEDIELSLAFWVDRLGFERVVAVPEGDRLGFVILVREGTELMLQTVLSIKNDLPELAPEHPYTKGCSLYIEVDDFEDVKRRLGNYPVVVPERFSSYGMREVGVSEPNGHSVVFAAKADSTKSGI